MSDPDFGALGYGCWYLANVDASMSDRLIRTALDQGIRLIDTADIYGFGTPADFGGAETRLGEILSNDPSLRDRMILATKGGITPPRPYDSSRGYLMGALEKSLQRLRVDYVDLYQIHRPDLMTPMADLAETLQAMLDSGKVKAIGVSNFTASQMRALSAHLKIPLRTIQPEVSVLEQSAIADGVLDYAQEIGATVLAWSALGGGHIFTETGPVQETLSRIANETGLTLTQVALAFTRSLGAYVVPLIGTTKPDRIIDAAAGGARPLDARQLYDLIEADRGVPMP